MSDRDVFERRLAEALQRYAAEASEDVDPMAVAHRVALEQPRARTTWRSRLALRPWLLARPVPVLVLMGVLVALIAASIQLRPSELFGPAASAPATSPTPSATFGTGAVYVTGTETRYQMDKGTSTQAGAVLQIRGQVATTTDSTTDARLDGTGTLRLSIDMNGTVGYLWGSYQLDNSLGLWQGSVNGATDASGRFLDISGWLTGSGAYEGYTYYFHADGSNAIAIDGIIFPGLAPVGTAPAGSNLTGSTAAP